MGRVPEAPGSSQVEPQSAQGLDPSDFDPSRNEQPETLTANSGEMDFVWPSLKEKGRVLVEIYGPATTYRWDADVLTYDGCAFWIQEGQGFDYWLESVDFPGPGTWVIEDIYGSFTRGDGWTTDDDEDWEWGVVRPATLAEIAAQTFCDSDGSGEAGETPESGSTVGDSAGPQDIAQNQSQSGSPS